MKQTIFSTTVLEEIERRKWSRYRFVQEFNGVICSPLLYQWLAGKKGMGEANIEKVFNKLELTVCRK